MADEEMIFNFNGTLQENGKDVLTEDDYNLISKETNKVTGMNIRQDNNNTFISYDEESNTFTFPRSLYRHRYFYGLSNSRNQRPQTQEYSETLKLPTADKPYLWRYENLSYTGGSITSNYPGEVILTYDQIKPNDGFSPTITTTPFTEGDRTGQELKIENKNNSIQTIKIYDGIKGDKGDKGDKGIDGTAPSIEFDTQITTDYSTWKDAFKIVKGNFDSEENIQSYTVTFPNYPGTNVYIHKKVSIAIEDKIPEIILYSPLDFYNNFLKDSEENSSEENEEESSEEELTLSQKQAVKDALYNGENFNFFTDKILHLTLPRGPKGEPAVFAENISAENITASIVENDEYSDSPRVIVDTDSSTDEDGNTSSNLSFVFEGIRGQTGSAPIIRDTNSNYETDDDGPRIIVNSSPASDEEGYPIKDTIDLDFTFYNLKGEPGVTKIEHVVNETPDDLVEGTPIVNIGTGQVESDEIITDEEGNQLSVGTNYLKVTRGKITPDAIVGTVKKINGGTGYGTANQDPDAVALPWSIAPATEDTDVIGARVIDELYQYLTQEDSVYININSIDDLLENNQNLYVYDSNNNEYEALDWNILKFEIRIIKDSNEQYHVYDLPNVSNFTIPLEYIDENNRVSWQKLVQRYWNLDYNVPFIYSYEDSLYPVSLDDNQNLIIGNDNDESILTSLIDNHLIDLSPLIQEESTAIDISFDDVYSIAYKFYDDNNIYKESEANKTEDSQSRYSIDSVKELATNLVNELLDLQDKVTKATKIAADDIILIGPATKVSDTVVIPKETDPDKLSRAKIWIRTVEEGE